MGDLALTSGLDVDALTRMFAAHGRISIPGFLDSHGAESLHRALVQAGGWKLTANRGEQVIDFDAAEVATWPAERRAKLDEAVVAGGRLGFQYLYETLRLSSNGTSSADLPLLRALADLLSAPEAKNLLRRVTGCSDIAFADAHASRYRAGHFLSTHDDKVEEMGRRAAYVLNLSPRWRVDWGGLLLFHDAQGNIARGFTPAFNSLTLFRVPQPHSVSMVTSLAPAPRYAVTGWLRARS